MCFFIFLAPAANWVVFSQYIAETQEGKLKSRKTVLESPGQHGVGQ